MRWFDPISERWIEHKEKPQEVVIPVAESEYDKGIRLAREHRIWEAVKDVSAI